MGRDPRPFWYTCFIIIGIMAFSPVVTGQDSSGTRTIFVDVTGNDNGNGSNLYPMKNLGDALDIARDGDTVSIAPGVYQTSGDREMMIDSGVRITGAGPEKTIIEGWNRSRVFLVNTSREVHFDNITITGGYSEGGGGIFIPSGNVRFTSTIIRNNYAQYGGGVLFRDGRVEFTDTLITNNTAARYGGGIHTSGPGTALISDSEISGNTAMYGGGMFHSGKGGVSVWRSIVIQNRAFDSGGGIRVSSGTMNLSCSVVSDNDGGINGGAASLRDGNVWITSSKIVNNTARKGGSAIALYTIRANLVAINNIFYNQENVGTSFGRNLDNPGGGTVSMPRTFQKSITGGKYSGGNVWAKPDGTGCSQNCRDGDDDGICDSSCYAFNILFDNYPLVLRESATSPALDKSLPCNVDSVPENITARHLPVRSSWGYGGRSLPQLIYVGQDVPGTLGLYLTYFMLSLPFLAGIFLFLHIRKIRDR